MNNFEVTEKTVCPHCNEEMKYNYTYEPSDFDTTYEKGYKEVVSYYCLNCIKEILIFIPKADGVEPRSIEMDICSVLADAEIL